MSRTAWALLVICSLGAAPPAFAGEPIPQCASGPIAQWTPDSGGNGHFYQLVCLNGTWNQANTDALADGRHLATLTTAEENAFVFGLVDNQGFWHVNEFACNEGPWLGGFQPAGSAEPSAAWSWVTGESFSFTAWDDAEPNNFNGVEEDHLQFYDCPGGARSAHWNDRFGGYVGGIAYVAEWEHSLDVDGDGEVLPLTDGLLILRSLFGFSGATLTTSAVDLADCTRCDAAAIEPFLALTKTGVVYDATADWSDQDNPNGPWAYMAGNNALPHVASWEPGGFVPPQPGWAPAASGNPRIPVFYKSVGGEMFDNDIDIGDVVIHSRDDQSGTGVGEGRLLFTAPATGTYRIDLDVWIGREIGRSVNWTLSVDGAQADTGNVSSGDGFSRASPDGHSTSVALEAGNQVDLLLTSQSSAGDFVGVELRLEAFGIDVDGDGEVGPLTDGLLILRRLFGFTGNSLVTGAVDLVNCTRCDATAIDGFFDSMSAP